MVLGQGKHGIFCHRSQPTLSNRATKAKNLVQNGKSLTFIPLYQLLLSNKLPQMQLLKTAPIHSQFLYIRSPTQLSQIICSEPHLTKITVLASSVFLRLEILFQDHSLLEELSSLQLRLEDPVSLLGASLCSWKTPPFLLMWPPPSPNPMMICPSQTFPASSSKGPMITLGLLK